MTISAPRSTSVGSGSGTSQLSQSKTKTKTKTANPDALPSETELAKAATVQVLDNHGQACIFQSLYSASDNNEKCLVIFVRHFFCGMCQDFLRHFSATVTPEYLATLPHPTKVIVIGCGSSDLIDAYASQTNCPYPIYTNPDRKLYRIFGMTSSMDLGPSRPEYQKGSVFEVVLKSTFQAIASGKMMFKSGNTSQVGGELLFIGGECSWCHRMQNTRGHTEISKFKDLVEH